jgi:hypothetical protein
MEENGLGFDFQKHQKEKAMTIPDLLFQAKIDAAKIRKKFKAVDNLWFKFENVPVVQLINHKHLLVMPLCKAINNRIQFQTAIELSDFTRCAVFIYSPEMTETEIVEILYPVQKDPLSDLTEDNAVEKFKLMFGL